MACYSTEPRDQIFMNFYKFLSFARNIGKNLSMNVGGEYSQKLLDHAKKSGTHARKAAAKNSRSNWWIDWQ